MTLNHWVEGSSPSGRTILKDCVNMVIVAQLVRAPGCGPGGRGFESLHSPHFFAQILGKKITKPQGFTSQCEAQLHSKGTTFSSHLH